MSKLNLKDYIKVDNVRKIIGEIEIYELTNEQREYIVELISDKELNSEGIELGSKITREFIRNNTNFGASVDEYSDEELSSIINNNSDLKLMLREIEAMFDEVIDDVVYNQTKELKVVNSLLNMMGKINDVDEIQKKMDKILKKNGIKDINELNKKNNKNKKK